MSSYGEDIIRETFEKLGDAIGVQMQIPDAMIANLGAVLQAQIDLLTELQSAGRLVPAGGMALTPEQVKDVRTVLEYAGGMPHESRIRLRRAALRLADAVGYPNAYLVQELREALAEVDGEFLATEPAEEEMKAEAAGERDALAMRLTGYGIPDLMAEGIATALLHDYQLKGSAFSPVVPAPTETGPWETVDAIPESVTRIEDCEGDVWHRCTAGWEHGGLHGPEGYVPFVAVEGN